MELKEARYILAIAREKNISKAAETLFISQPSLSKYLKNLEQQLGTRLFDRIGSSYHPTYLGERYIHYAENTSGENRLILFCDIERPMRYRWAQKVNHWLGRNLMSAAAAPNDVGDRTGGINRSFRYICQIRIIGKRLKKWNKTVYYIVKWLLFGGIALLIWQAF